MMEIDYTLSARIIKLCLEKHGAEAVKGYVSNIHPKLVNHCNSQDEIISHFQWLESKKLVRYSNAKLASTGVPRFIISLTDNGYEEITQRGILPALGFRE